jgi:hypothetical protein
MDFEDLVKYVKQAGCKVILYRDKDSLKGGQCAGYFNQDKKKNIGPYICMATSGLEVASCAELLLHEFSHYLQWKDGTETEAIDKAYEDWEKWLGHRKKLTPERLEEIRKAVLAHEWDAEMRAIKLGKNLKVKSYNPTDVLRGANGYMTTIKWSFQTRQASEWIPRREYFKPRMLTQEELFKPLTKRQVTRIGCLLKELAAELK